MASTALIIADGPINWQDNISTAYRKYWDRWDSVCVINRALFKAQSLGVPYQYLASYHIPMLDTLARGVGLEPEECLTSNAQATRCHAYPVQYGGGSSVYMAALILHEHLLFNHVCICNMPLSGGYSDFLLYWKEKAPHLSWCRAFDGPLVDILGPAQDFVTEEQD